MNEFEIKNFCSFEASKAMKDMGFDGGVIAYYEKGRIIFTQPTIDGMELVKNTKEDEDVAASTFTDATAWFREAHNIFIEVRFMEYSEECFYLIFDRNWGKGETLRGDNFKLEPEAYNAAIIKACGIVKEKLTNNK